MAQAAQDLTERPALSDLFAFRHVDGFPSINGYRLGRVPDERKQLHWNEINAALGQVRPLPLDRLFLQEDGDYVGNRGVGRCFTEVKNHCITKRGRETVRRVSTCQERASWARSARRTAQVSTDISRLAVLGQVFSL